MIEIFPSSPYAQLQSIDAEEQESEPEPRVSILEYDRAGNYTRLSTEPLPSGYGNTLGNALKRALVRNVPGSAIFSINVLGLNPTDEKVPGAEESVLDFILNTRKVVVVSISNEIQVAVLDVSGKRRVTARDIVCPVGLSVVNPDAHLLALNAEDSSVYVEFQINKGTGYNLGETQMSEDGKFYVDAVYTPVRRVNTIMEPTRVGRRTDFEKMTLEVWTDGSIDPIESVNLAGCILRDSFLRISKAGLQDVEGDGYLAAISPELYAMAIERLPISNRILNALKRNKLNMVGEVLEQSTESLTSLRNFGAKSLHELITVLNDNGCIPPKHPFIDFLNEPMP